MQAVRHHCPRLVPFVDFCYAASSQIQFGDHIIQSSRGVQQGDPLGPILYSLAVQSVVLAAHQKVREVH
eukprot:4204848-Amphidinium_carterae.1